jgi:hypothetical protein
MTSPQAETQSRRLTVTLLIALTVAPVLLSTATYFYWKPTGGKSFGQLLPVRPVPAFAMQRLDGTAASLAEFKGKWLLVVVDDGRCDQHCKDALYAIRQYRIAQGTEMSRVERLWLVTGDMVPDPAAVAAADGAQIRRAMVRPPLPGDVTAGIYLLDPLGNQVMRYARDDLPAKVIKEIGRLLKNNQAIG